MSMNTVYRGVFLVVGVVAFGAALFGFYGVYMTLGDADVDDEPSILGEYQCEEFDGDPEMPHESQFESPRTVVDDTYLASFEANVTEAGRQIEVTTDGPLINASASEADGTVVEVERFPDEDRVLIPDRDVTPFRLFVDSISGDTPVRTEVAICPPGE